MIVIERPSRTGIMVKAYFGAELEYLNFTPGMRVLPAAFFDEPNLTFTLKKQHDVGEPFFPDGGFELYGPNGEKRSYDLDQVIVHPFELRQFNYFKKQANIPAEKKNEVINPDAPKRKRGRPANPNKVEKTEYVPTGGKRGRPANPNKAEKKPYVPTGGKRGRKPLPPEVKAQREKAAAAKALMPKSGRGRPKKGPQLY
jgi:hypothetical protein